MLARSRMELPPHRRGCPPEHEAQAALDAAHQKAVAQQQRVLVQQGEGDAALGAGPRCCWTPRAAAARLRPLCGSIWWKLHAHSAALSALAGIHCRLRWAALLRAAHHGSGWQGLHQLTLH